MKNSKLLYKYIIDCDESTIKIIDKYNMFHCEDPICNDSCNLKVHYQCIKKSNNTNNPLINECPCDGGWDGQLCDNMVFFDTK